jgi:hypothetical protein
VGYSTIVVSDAVPGHNYALQISSTELNGGVPVTVSYQCVAGDTKEVIATKLSAACRANAVLYDPATGLPILFWDTGGGGFNVQPSCLLGESFTVTAPANKPVGQGHIELPANQQFLDYAVTILGRNIPGYKLRGGDSLHALQFMANNRDGSYSLIPALISIQFPDAINGNAVMYLGVMREWMPQTQWGIAGSGTVLFGDKTAMPTGAFMGAGWLNVAGGLAVNGVSVAAQIQELRDEIAALKGRLQA